MDKVTYTPPEFAAVFGKERTWAYRQLYNGKVQAITELGRTLIPKSEVDRLLKEAGRYLGAKAKVGKAKPSSIDNRKASKGANKWVDAIKQRKSISTKEPKSASTHSDTTTKRENRGSVSSAAKSVYQRITRKR